VTTLVVCVDRAGDIGGKTGLTPPVVGWEAVRSLVTDVGLADPEDSSVNSLLETLRVARDLEAEGEEAVVAVVTGGADSMVGADRAVAAQVDELVAAHEPDSAVVVTDSAEDERLVPIVESRVRVDSVDRVVVRQARDIESTYYLLKQFLADEELRQTVLVPLGIALVVFPALATFGIGVAVGAITAVFGLFLLYKGFAVDDRLSGLGGQVKEALYTGQVSVVTYVVAAGLTLGGLFAGGFRVSDLPGSTGVFVTSMLFAYSSVPWLAMAALAASTGRLIDEAIRAEGLRGAYLNLPFLVVGVGLVVRGFSGYFLERQGVLDSFSTAGAEILGVALPAVVLSQGQRLGVFVLAGFLVTFVGVRVAASLSGTTIEEEFGDGESSP